MNSELASVLRFIASLVAVFTAMYGYKYWVGFSYIDPEYKKPERRKAIICWVITLLMFALEVLLLINKV